MIHNPLARRDFLRTLAAGGVCLAAPALAQEGESLREPVFRVSKTNNEPQEGPAGHPLDPAIKLAQESLAHFQNTVVDYTALIVSRERVNGVVGQYEYMEAKIRNQKIENGRVVKPLSVYLKFVKPQAAAGREILWLQDENNNKMLVNPSDGDGRFIPSIWMKPDGPIAMRGRLHPLTFIGIENLIVKLIERGERERRYGECDVRFIKGAKINDRVCTVLEVEHPVPRQHFEFNVAQIFIDDELQMPIRYAAYLWPTTASEKRLDPGLVIEEYTYLKVKLNQDLTDADFSRNNPNYQF
ncbi:MAG TPA: DUF1571 domain-containing protein [Pirellulaceae bacterium]|nr:DUF1571 domain-containing protein [Pirellulaceae bacterium]